MKKRCYVRNVNVHLKFILNFQNTHMKKFALAPIALVFFFSCQTRTAKQEAIADETPVTSLTSRQCASQEVLEEQMAADPSLRQRMSDIENFTRRTISSGQLGRFVNGTMEIPVVVNVVYNTAAENISDGQIQSQIAVLNEDYQMLNADNTKVPANFAGVKGAMNIRFVLNSVVRKKTNKKSWGTNDAVKKSSLGGIDPTSPTTMLNMWSCNLGQSLLGYAQFPGGAPATDGVVILYSSFGSRAKFPGGTYIANYDLGRTATHEVGHWLNLRHIWGDATCGSDLVDDTPVHNTSNGGCPPAGHLSTCAGTPQEMWMNYMDYTYDACMYMFSQKQVDRMNAIFVTGGPRASFQ
ncbi:MAG: Pregnancy-associated plasma protein-A [Flaviaesturariibacter sp.]|nr:Pregnancy-associated plasma protein-A [Flaviaesturariibacter sp.]